MEESLNLIFKAISAPSPDASAARSPLRFASVEMTNLDGLTKVDDLFAKAKSLKDSMAELTLEDLVAKYKKPLRDDELDTYFENQKLKSAIEGILIDKFKLSGSEVEKLSEVQKE